MQSKLLTLTAALTTMILPPDLRAIGASGLTPIFDPSGDSEQGRFTVFLRPVPSGS